MHVAPGNDEAKRPRQDRRGRRSGESSNGTVGNITAKRRRKKEGTNVEEEKETKKILHVSKDPER